MLVGVEVGVMVVEAEVLVDCDTVLVLPLIHKHTASLLVLVGMVTATAPKMEETQFFPLSLLLVVVEVVREMLTKSEVLVDQVEVRVVLLVLMLAVLAVKAEMEVLTIQEVVKLVQVVVEVVGLLVVLVEIIEEVTVVLAVPTALVVLASTMQVVVVVG